MTTPEWLKQRGGELKPATTGRWFVYFDQQAQYSLSVVPVDGKYGCVVRQTINGNRIDHSAVSATQDDALAGGLGALGKSLGWIA